MTNYQLTVLVIILGFLAFGIFAGVIAHLFEEKATHDPFADETFGDASTYGREKHNG